MSSTSMRQPTLSTYRTTVGIVGQTATKLATLVAASDVSASEVVEAHIARIEETNPQLNALVAARFDEARAEAQAADSGRARGELLGPLHGVPVTIKELFDVTGTPTTAGLTSRRNHIATRDAPLVARLKRAGAIVLGKTNVPQIGMLFESENPVYGRTRNPWNLDRAPGGSSGGEAALIAAGGSPLGLGSDGGGSIRQPCHSCGIFGIKPTGRRFSLEGSWTLPNWSLELAQPGPLARCVDDLELALDVLNTESTGVPWDLDAPPVGLRRSNNVRLEELRVGYYTDDGLVSPAPAVRRAVSEAARALESFGVEVEEFRPLDIEEVWRLFFGTFYADGAECVKRALSGSAVDWRLARNIVWFSRLPGIARPLLARLLDAFGQRWMARPCRWVRRRSLSVCSYYELLAEQQRYRQRFADQLDAAGIDVLICPASPVPAFRHGCAFANLTASYTLLYNLLGMPAGVVPATRVRVGEESDRPASRDALECELARVEAGSEGLPVGVQVVGRHWREDVVLAVMRALESHFAKNDADQSTSLIPRCLADCK